MFTFSTTQIAELTAIKDDTSYARPWAAFYRAVADMAEGQDGVDPESITWLRTAADVNERVGAESAFIRAYNKLQYTARYGGSISDAAMDDASDDIAREIFNALESSGILPNIHDIALNDAGPTADALFGGDASGWAGNPLFLYLGHSDAFYNNIINDEPDNPYDALAMMKFFSQANQIAAGSSSFWDVLTTGFSTLLQYQQHADVVGSANASLHAFIQNNYGVTPSNFPNFLNSSDIILGQITGDDILIGNSYSNFIHGGGGDDIILGAVEIRDSQSL